MRALASTKTIDGRAVLRFALNCGAKENTPIFRPAGAYSLPLQRKAVCACGGGCLDCQTKSSNLNISQPNDPTEIEAAQIADKVIRIPEGEGKPVANEARQGNTLHRKANPASASSPSSPEIFGLSGRPLDAKTREFFEPRFGTDLSHVRIHTDSAAGQSAWAINAKAYTLGNNIVFGNNEYNPESESGRHLIAHELGHVAQYSGFAPGEAGLNKSTKTIFRFVVPNPGSYSDPLPPVSDRAKELFAKLSTLREKVSAKKLPYTDGTVRAVEGVTKSMYYAILRLEGITTYRRSIPISRWPAYHYSYGQGAAPLQRPERVFRVMEFYIAEIGKELDRPPKDDPNQEGNILGYWRKWDKKHKEAFELQEFIESLDQMEQEQPGDYPMPPDTGTQIA